MKKFPKNIILKISNFVIFLFMCKQTSHFKDTWKKWKKISYDMGALRMYGNTLNLTDFISF